jgi:hypothetical protein
LQREAVLALGWARRLEVHHGAVVLEVEAINPVRVAFIPGLSVFASWEVTCGFCRTRFRRFVLELIVGSRMSWAGCPACGTHNLLPHHPSLRDRSE